MVTNRPTRFKWKDRGVALHILHYYICVVNNSFWVTFGADSAASVLTSFDVSMFCDAGNVF